VPDAKILTVSTSTAAGERDDRSGPELAAALEAHGFTVVGWRVVADGLEPVADAVAELAEAFAGLLVTTGGTGFAPSDVTPEATSRVLDRYAPGLAEAMRAASPKGRLSRAVAGTIGRSIVINTPGSPGGATECLGAVIDVLPHALALLADDQGAHQAHP